MLFQKISIALTLKLSWLNTLSISLEIPILNLHAFLKEIWLLRPLRWVWSFSETNHFHTEFFHFAGASALWALAGVTRHQKQRIASMIGINILVDMLMLKSETLQFIAGMAIIALTTENIENQNKIVAGGGVQPLVRLLRSPKTSEKVC